MGIKGTRTEQNLLKSFAGESQARMRYTYFAKRRQEGGLRPDLEPSSARRPTTRRSTPRSSSSTSRADRSRSRPPTRPGVIGTTAENLFAAAEGEHEEWTELYPTFADIAEEEGFEDVATRTARSPRSKTQHENRYRKLLENVERRHASSRRTARCGGSAATAATSSRPPQAPAMCPACKHPQKYFELLAENY